MFYFALSADTINRKQRKLPRDHWKRVSIIFRRVLLFSRAPRNENVTGFAGEQGNRNVRSNFRELTVKLSSSSNEFLKFLYGNSKSACIETFIDLHFSLRDAEPIFLIIPQRIISLFNNCDEKTSGTGDFRNARFSSTSTTLETLWPPILSINRILIGIYMDSSGFFYILSEIWNFMEDTRLGREILFY